MAGGGVKGGQAYGATDEFGYEVVENKVHVHDLHATMLHQLGIHHEAFSVKFQGLDARLSGVEGATLLKDILV
jgi:hypothetical protein